MYIVAHIVRYQVLYTLQISRSDPPVSRVRVHTISVLLAKGRARVSVADAATDWPKRIRDMQYLDHESIVAGA